MTEGYERAWIQSYKGNKLHLAELKESDLDIEEIGHALSNTCRFGGHCREYYSVAEHCYIMSHLVDKELALAALLHDASEYMLTDVPKPFKFLMPEFGRYEAMIQDVVDKRYNVDTRHHSIKTMDQMMVVSEAKALLDPNEEWIRNWPYPSIVRFEKDWLACLEPKAAKFAYLHRYQEILNER